MQSRRPEENVLSPLPTDSIASFLGYMQRRLSDFVALDARPIPSLLSEYQSRANDGSSSALVNGTTFETIDVITQHTFIESPPLRRAG